MHKQRFVVSGLVAASLTALAVCCVAASVIALAFAGGGADLPPTTFTATPPRYTPALTATPTKPGPTPTLLPTVSPHIPFPTPAAASLRYPVTLNESYAVKPYAVVGNTPQEIRRSLNANGVTDPNEPGQRFDANVVWHLSGGWEGQPTANGCELKDAAFTLKVTLNIPALTIGPATTNELLQGWNAYVERLKLHEAGHIDTSVKQARKLRDDFGNFPPAPNCDTLDQRLQARFDQTIQTIKALDIRYDADTQHGATQGAVYP